MANVRKITLTGDPHWDDEVDVVCTDAGAAGLAGAIRAVDAGAKVLVARSPAPQVSGTAARHPGWFRSAGGDHGTSEYLAGLTDEPGPETLPRAENVVPIRLTPVPVADPGRKIPPFVGSKLAAWTARCIAAPTGYLYTRVSDWTSVAMESEGGDAIEVAEIGSITSSPSAVEGLVLEWLDDEAHLRGVDVCPVAGLERLVFDQGAVIGAVFATSDGPLAVRARHGVLVCGAGFPLGRVPPLPAAGDAEFRVALVSKAASRFGRVELLTSDQAVVRAAAAPSEAMDRA